MVIQSNGITVVIVSLVSHSLATSGFGGGSRVYYVPVSHHTSGYSSSSQDNSYAVQVIYVILVILFRLWIESQRRESSKGRVVDVIKQVKEFVNDEEAENEHEYAVGFLSGVWKGYYRQEGADHLLCQFQLQEIQSGSSDDGELASLTSDREGHSGIDNIHLEGFGVDSVGEYKIVSGIFNPRNQRMYFVKRYIEGTGNSDQNLGHRVVYCGLVQGGGERGLAPGVRGTWFTATSQYEGNGTFHIWPEAQRYGSEEWDEAADIESGNDAYAYGGLRNRKISIRSESTSIATLSGFQASPNNECAVCFDQAINTALRPCGHIALCAACAHRLDECPICRDPIECIEELQLCAAGGSAVEDDPYEVSSDSGSSDTVASDVDPYRLY